MIKEKLSPSANTFFKFRRDLQLNIDFYPSFIPSRLYELALKFIWHPNGIQKVIFLFFSFKLFIQSIS